jgi:hypothetical protein
MVIIEDGPLTDAHLLNETEDVNTAIGCTYLRSVSVEDCVIISVLLNQSPQKLWANVIGGDNFLGTPFAFSPGIECEHAPRMREDKHNARMKVPGTAFFLLATSCFFGSARGAPRSQCRQPKNKRVQKLKKKVRKVRGPNLPTSPSTKATWGLG